MKVNLPYRIHDNATLGIPLKRGSDITSEIFLSPIPSFLDHLHCTGLVYEIIDPRSVQLFPLTNRMAVNHLPRSSLSWLWVDGVLP